MVIAFINVLPFVSSHMVIALSMFYLLFHLESRVVIVSSMFHFIFHARFQVEW